MNYDTGELISIETLVKKLIVIQLIIFRSMKMTLRTDYNRLGFASNEIKLKNTKATKR